MKFSEFCSYLEKLEKISLRNEMTVVLAELFKKLAPEEILPAVYMLQGRTAPTFTGIEFNFSVKLLLKAFARVQNQDIAEINALYKKEGDIGLTGAKLRKDSKSKNWEIAAIYQKLQELAALSGKNSQSDKQNLFIELTRNCSAEEVKYLARIVAGNLRVGFSNKTILDGISWAVKGDKSLRELLDYAYGVRVDLGKIAEVALTGGEKALKEIKCIAGTPVAPKLVERERSAEGVFARLGECFIQPKYDGLRMQIHYSKKGWKYEYEEKNSAGLLVTKSGLHHVAIFSRNMENITGMFPDIAAIVQKFQVDSIVLDSEAIGFHPESGKLLPFQETMTRKRKNDILEVAKNIPLKVFTFDVLYFNGKDLLKTPLEERSGKLKEILAANKNDNIVFAETTRVQNTAEISGLFTRYVNEGLEGIIAKSLSDPYEPGTRNYVWIKLKASSQSGLADTVDAVVLGYYLGTGVRAKFGIGAILIGIYDDKREKFMSLTKVGTGFKDEQWGVIKPAIDKVRVDRMPENVEIEKLLLPDVFCKPEIVVVVEADSISKSKSATGFSLRFPRLKEFGRKDKDPEQITTLNELQEMFSLVKKGR